MSKAPSLAQRDREAKTLAELRGTPNIDTCDGCGTDYIVRSGDHEGCCNRCALTWGVTNGLSRGPEDA